MHFGAYAFLWSVLAGRSALRNAGEAVRDPHENPPSKCGLQRGRDNRYEEEGDGEELIPNPGPKHRERRLPNL